MRSYLIGLLCPSCGSETDPAHLVGTCPACGGTLFPQYDLESARRDLTPKTFRERDSGLWRYFELLPVQSPESIVSLGEPTTPVVSLRGSEEEFGVQLLAKDDGLLPTGTFKARGMTVAVSRARELGARSLFVPSAGNAGVAAAAYAARANLPLQLYVPSETPAQSLEVARRLGAIVHEVPGTLTDAGQRAREREREGGGVELSTLREPYRVEGKKTMALELFDALGAEGLPDVIVYPTGGGTGLIGMAKGFRELQSLGWIERIPRLIAVQSAGCAPVVRAFRDGRSSVERWERPRTIAAGLRVPFPFASERILEAIQMTKGTAVAVPDSTLRPSMEAMARRHGLIVSPEAAATFAAMPDLVRSGAVRPGATVLLYVTGTGLGYSPESSETATTRPISRKREAAVPHGARTPGTKKKRTSPRPKSARAR